MIVIEDCESNQHCSLTVYHQELDAILTKNEDGYIVLNPEVIPSIKKTAEEEEQPEEEESDEESEEESDDCCLEVEEVKEDRRGDETVEAKRPRVE